MRDVAAGRLCAQCDRTVHRADRLDERGLDSLLERAGRERVCIEVRHHRGGIALAGGLMAAVAVSFGCAATPPGRDVESPQEASSLPEATPSDAVGDAETVESDAQAAQCGPDQAADAQAPATGRTLSPEFLDQVPAERGVVHTVELAAEPAETTK